MSKKLKTIVSISIVAILGLLACRMIFIKDKKPSFFGLSSYLISSSSMEPNYPVNSLIIIKKTPFNNLVEGDVIVFKSAALGGAPAFHRIIEVTENGVYTKGDNNAIEDNQLITEKSYVGKGVLKVKSSNLLAKVFLTPYGVIAFVVVPALIIIWFYHLIVKIKKLKKIRKE